MSPLPATVLPAGIRARLVDGVNGLTMHVLEAGHEIAGRPLILLLHGFPELAYSWRKIMPALAGAGFHVVAPDQRGYGRTTGWRADYDQDLRPFAMRHLADDARALVGALGHRAVHAVIGHDFGSPVAAWCALIQPDVFRSVVLMSAPFPGPPAPPVGTPPPPGPSSEAMERDLARLTRPRKHYQRYYATRPANGDMRHCPQGVAAFLRAYFHVKSADWPGNEPYRLKDGSAETLALMPTYYIMDLNATMAATVASFLPNATAIAACSWLPEDELAIYAGEYEHTGFQGGLNWYRASLDSGLAAELAQFAGRRIEVPALFIAGRSDWGVFQTPGAYERMQGVACARMIGCHLIEGAGHWVMQERPDAVGDLLIEFCRRIDDVA